VYDLEPCSETATAQKTVLHSLDEKCTPHADGSTDLFFGPTAQAKRTIPTETPISIRYVCPRDHGMGHEARSGRMGSTSQTIDPTNVSTLTDDLGPVLTAKMCEDGILWQWGGIEGSDMTPLGALRVFGNVGGSRRGHTTP
jgi:hypothetical protein